MSVLSFVNLSFVIGPWPLAIGYLLFAICYLLSAIHDAVVPLSAIHDAVVPLFAIHDAVVRSRQADICDLFFVPPEVMAQFVEVGNPYLAEKRGPPIIRGFSQRTNKERDPWHFIRLNRRPLQQGIPFKNPQTRTAFSSPRQSEKHGDLRCAGPDRLRQPALNLGDLPLGNALPIDHPITVRQDRLQSRDRRRREDNTDYGRLNFIKVAERSAKVA
jgi:hypothetical protein